jgi:hypothetical protein
MNPLTPFLVPPQGLEDPAEEGKQKHQQEGYCVHPVNRYWMFSSNIYKYYLWKELKKEASQAQVF